MALSHKNKALSGELIQFNLSEHKYDPRTHVVEKKLAANYFTYSPLVCLAEGHGRIKHELSRSPRFC